MAISEETIKRELLTVPQAAEELGILARSVYRAADDGRISLVTLSGNRKMVRREDLEEYKQKMRDYGPGRPRTQSAPGPRQDTTVPDGYLTPGEAADRLGMSRPWVYVAMRTGQLDYRKIGSRRMIPLASIERFVATSRDRAASTLDLPS